MSTIECFTVMKYPSPNDLLDIFESVITGQKKTFHQELTTMTHQEDKLYEIPSSIVEISFQEGK